METARLPYSWAAPTQPQLCPEPGVVLCSLKMSITAPNKSLCPQIVAVGCLPSILHGRRSRVGTQEPQAELEAQPDRLEPFYQLNLNSKELIALLKNPSWMRGAALHTS